jgi:hypothetical protein
MAIAEETFAIPARLHSAPWKHVHAEHGNRSTSLRVKLRTPISRAERFTIQEKDFRLL